jgi:hypothetical protein
MERCQESHRVPSCKMGYDLQAKVVGRLGIQNLKWFTQALATKSLWRALFGSSLWSKSMTKKYLKGVDVSLWMRMARHKAHNASNF